MPAEPHIIGWDVGGAHLKGCVLSMAGGAIVDAAQWPCPLWRGLDHLEQAFEAAFERWPQMRDAGACRHALTMSGEMADLFHDREEGVARITALAAHRLAPALLQVFAGDVGWRRPHDARAGWRDIASANWLATALHTALARPRLRGFVVDIGSTTTDLIAFGGGRVLTRARSDAERLASGELCYLGVVRTPLLALGPRLAWNGRESNLMNELFATTADVFRTTAELAAEHDQQPSADGAPKDAASTRRRLARMVGADAREADDAYWLGFAQALRARLVERIAADLLRSAQLHGFDARARGLSIIGTGCGAFLLPSLLDALGWIGTPQRYADAVAHIGTGAAPGTADWVQVAAPCVAVASLAAREIG